MGGGDSPSRKSAQKQPGGSVGLSSHAGPAPHSRSQPPAPRLGGRCPLSSAFGLEAVALPACILTRSRACNGSAIKWHCPVPRVPLPPAFSPRASHVPCSSGRAKLRCGRNPPHPRGWHLAFITVGLGCACLPRGPPLWPPSETKMLFLGGRVGPFLGFQKQSPTCRPGCRGKLMFRSGSMSRRPEPHSPVPGPCRAGAEPTATGASNRHVVTPPRLASGALVRKGAAWAERPQRQTVSSLQGGVLGCPCWRPGKRGTQPVPCAWRGGAPVRARPPGVSAVARDTHRRWRALRTYRDVGRGA